MRSARCAPPPDAKGDHYLLNGTKLFITNGPIADVLLTYAKTSSELGSHGISAFIVERKNFPGVSVAQKLTKMGFRGSQTGELVFKDCRVPVENRLGSENGGLRVLMTGLGRGARHHRGDLPRRRRACAAARRSSTPRQRKQFGRPIADFEMIQAKLADMYVWTETMRVLIYRVLSACDAAGAEAGGRGLIHAQSAASVLYAAETMAKRGRRGRADPRRRRLHLGVRDQSTVSRREAARDRRWHERDPPPDHRARAARRRESVDDASISAMQVRCTSVISSYRGQQKIRRTVRLAATAALFERGMELAPKRLCITRRFE